MIVAIVEATHRGRSGINKIYRVEEESDRGRKNNKQLAEASTRSNS